MEAKKKMHFSIKYGFGLLKVIRLIVTLVINKSKLINNSRTNERFPCTYVHKPLEFSLVFSSF